MIHDEPTRLHLAAIAVLTVGGPCLLFPEVLPPSVRALVVVSGTVAALLLAIALTRNDRPVTSSGKRSGPGSGRRLARRAGISRGPVPLRRVWVRPAGDEHRCVVVSNGKPPCRGRRAIPLVRAYSPVCWFGSDPLQGGRTSCEAEVLFRRIQQLVAVF